MCPSSVEGQDSEKDSAETYQLPTRPAGGKMGASVLQEEGGLGGQRSFVTCFPGHLGLLSVWRLVDWIADHLSNKSSLSPFYTAGTELCCIYNKSLVPPQKFHLKGSRNILIIRAASWVHFMCHVL